MEKTFDSVRSKKSNNLKERAQIIEAQGKLLLGPSIGVHPGRGGGLPPTQNCWHGWQDFELVVNALHISFLCKNVFRVSLAQSSDRHVSVGWKGGVNSTLATVAQRTHVLSRVTLS